MPDITLFATTGAGAVALPAKKISELPAASAANDSDMLEASQTDGPGVLTSRSLTVAQVSARVPASLGFASGVLTWLQTPSSANLALAVTDETGTGALVFNNSPSLINPTITGASTSIAGYLALSGGTMTGAITL